MYQLCFELFECLRAYFLIFRSLVADGSPRRWPYLVFPLHSVQQRKLGKYLAAVRPTQHMIPLDDTCIFHCILVFLLRCCG